MTVGNQLRECILNSFRNGNTWCMEIKQEKEGEND